jgi:hypothetical protein
MKAQTWEWRYTSTHSLTSAADEGGWSTPHPGALHPRERRGTHRIRGCVDPSAGLEVCENLVPTRIRSPDGPAHSESLYRLSHPGPRHASTLSPTPNDIYVQRCPHIIKITPTQPYTVISGLLNLCRAVTTNYNAHVPNSSILHP